MKKILILAVVVFVTINCKSQELIFKMNQAGNTAKDLKTGRYAEMQVFDSKATIVLANNHLIVSDNEIANYRLVNSGFISSSSSASTTFRADGLDEKDQPVTFTYTVNKRTKETILELIYGKNKNVYFGTCSTADISMQP